MLYHAKYSVELEIDIDDKVETDNVENEVAYNNPLDDMGDAFSPGLYDITNDRMVGPAAGKLKDLVISMGGYAELVIELRIECDYEPPSYDNPGCSYLDFEPEGAYLSNASGKKQLPEDLTEELFYEYYDEIEEIEFPDSAEPFDPRESANKSEQTIIESISTTISDDFNII